MPKPKEKSKEDPPEKSQVPNTEIPSSESSVSASTKTKATTEEIEAAKDDAVARFFPGSKPKKKEEPSDKTKAPEEKEKGATPEPKPEEHPEPKPKKAPPKTKEPAEPPPPALDLVEKALKNAPEEPPPEKKEPPKPKGDVKEERLLAACEHLEKTDPRYEGLKQAMVDFWEKEQEYIAKWEKENPDKTFNPEEEAHAAFYRENEPEVDPEDLEEARIAVAARRIVDSEMKGKAKDIDEKDRKARIQQTLQAARPRIDGETFGAISSLIEQSHPDFAKLLKKDEKTGATYLDDEASSKMDEVDPVGKEILMEVAEPLSVIVREIEIMRALGNDYGGPGSDRWVRLQRTEGWIAPRQEVLQLLNRTERALKEATEEDPHSTTRDGRRFLTMEEMTAARDNVEKSKATKQRKEQILEDLARRYYTIDYDDAIAAAVAEYSTKAQKKLERVSKFRPKPASETPPKGKEENPPKPSETKPRKAPAISAASDVGDKGSVTGGKHAVDPKVMEQRMGWA